MSPLWVAVILGLVEGLTEFIPVSSTGHLIIAGHLVGFTGAKAATFEVFIQLGAILAVAILERRRLAALLRPSARQGLAGPRGCALLAVTSFPALAIGWLLHDWIKEALFGPVTVAWALGVGGIVILIVERTRPAPCLAGVDDLGWREAIQIGLFQVLALWPGVSRSGATIVGGLLSGLDRRAAASYSFLAAIPVMGVATIYDLLKAWPTLEASDALPFAVGFVVSFLAAWAAVRTFIALLGRGTLRPFAWYRIAVAPIILLVVT